MRVWGEDPLLCPKCKTTMKVAGKVIRPEEVEFFLRLFDLWEGVLAIPPPPDPPFDVETLEQIRTPPEFCWWKPNESDPFQFQLHAVDESNPWEPPEVQLDDERVLVLDGDPHPLPPDEFPDFFQA